MSVRRVEVVVIGGGPAGAATAAGLAGMGHDVVLLERAPSWRWRAAGVFSSPAAMTELRALGMDETMLRRVARPIPAMRVETTSGTAFRLTYGAEAGAGSAVGFDRSTLDPALLGLATTAGAEVRIGSTVRAVELADHRQPASVAVRDEDGTELTIEARVLVGADGPRSLVAAAAGVERRPRLGDRVGLTWHVADRDAASKGDASGERGNDGAESASHGGQGADEPRDARMVVLAGGAYCGIAPVPRGRVNVGIVLAGRGWRDRLARDGAAAVGEHVLRSVPPLPGDAEAWREGRATDAIAGASPLGCRVDRRAGPGWLLVGDAAGFLDPFTGEGLHRALVSARLAAAAIHDDLRGASPRGLAAYDREMRDRFATKDRVSRLVQIFLGRPALFEYAARRLAQRDTVRATMGLVMGDLVPASRALDPRFLAALLAP